ncbi:zinc finger-like protein [Pochonia chlamydosporia 170]|uniref:Zinc finger-like protein n=1 Tax=Pochonia chlamydosporia 170 TaxID=1380566 RepID=A0A179G8C9_METCM|nr:zinc finger-like protein [Pochonia chlamydosporia 170]OAQ73778.1 zinc finger-like protein [Pochonia chlamydosporia 170]
MGDSLHLDDHRPAKRIKLSTPSELHHHREAEESSQHQPRHSPPPPQLQPPEVCQSHPYSYQQLQAQQPSSHPVSQQLPHSSKEHAASVPSSGRAMASLDGPDNSPGPNNPWPTDSVFDPSWRWPLSASNCPPPSSHVLHLGASRDNLETGHVFASPQQPPVSGPSSFDPTSLPTSSAVSSTSQLDFTTLSPSDSFYSSQPAQFEAVFPTSVSRSPVTYDSVPPSIPEVTSSGHQPPERSVAHRNDVLRSPFRDCIGTFGLHKSQFFSRPADGRVNGYIKFSWPKESRGKQTPTERTPSISDAPRVIEIDDSTETSDEFASQSSMSVIGPSPAPLRGAEDSIEFTVDVSSFFSQPVTFSSMSHTPVGFTPSPVLSNAPTEVASMGAPKLLPAQYGYEAKMDDTDRRFWMFYIRNWCPGRSVLEDTNLWLKDFAQMHKSLGVRSAIQSLAGIYIYDYLPLDSIRKRVNQRFSDAEDRLTQLLNDPATARDESLANELITIAVILSMQDIVLTERRLKKPFSPRWLQGFRQGEQFLQSTDHGSRFWKASNVQASSLRISQSIIVGRAVILAQPMSSLPPPDKFNAQEEASRFGWLLYGTEKDMYQIHGGCGFSKKLLHTLGQITYCAARLQQEPESAIVPMTADYLHTDLLNMRQWSSESKSWEVAKSGPPVIKWVRSQADNYEIHTNAWMTDVTAEAWRFAAILYLQCRVFRLPRNHPEVVSKLDDLARCITIMPTSGSHFTAQAPLFPVFLLGLLATVPRHKAVSSTWFNEVLQTPVRSSVPPLHKALQHIWSWIDREIPVALPPNLEIDLPIHSRQPWWELLVTRVQDQEQEVLCLT